MVSQVYRYVSFRLRLWYSARFNRFVICLWDHGQQNVQEMCYDVEEMCYGPIQMNVFYFCMGSGFANEVLNYRSRGL